MRQLGITAMFFLVLSVILSTAYAGTTNTALVSKPINANQTWVIESVDFTDLGGSAFTIGVQPIESKTYQDTVFLSDGFQQLIAIMAELQAIKPRNLVGKTFESKTDDPMGTIVGYYRKHKLTSLREEVLEATAHGFVHMQIPNFVETRQHSWAITERFFTQEARTNGQVSASWLSRLNERVKTLSHDQVHVEQASKEEFAEPNDKDNALLSYIKVVSKGGGTMLFKLRNGFGSYPDSYLIYDVGKPVPLTDEEMK